ncbi:MAG: methyltransferase [Haloarculaceae archaeon]
MKEAQRQAVLDNARYLQQVRPVDPEEIFEYVEGQPHPAAVRQILREEATTLGLIERESGTFVPVPDDPISPSLEPIEEFPREHARVVEGLLVDTFGPDWHEGPSGDRLRTRIREVKRRYLAGETVEYDEVTALGYAVYHLPATYAAARSLLGALAAEGHLGRDLRILDVGAGVGGQALALFDLLPANALLEYHAVEPSAAAEVLEDLVADAGRNVHATVHRVPVERHEPAGAFDLVLCANVLSELAAPGQVVADLLDALSGGGTLLAIAPADRNTAIGLRQIEREVERKAGATIYAPTCRLWPDETPTSPCWSFDREPPLSVPAVQSRLDGAGGGVGEFINADVRFAYSVLRTDDTTRLEVRPSTDRFAKMAASERHVTDRVDLVAVKLSHDLTRTRPGFEDNADEAQEEVRIRDGKSDGRDANPLFLVGDGSEAVDHFAVRTKATSLNADLVDTAYGQALVFEGVLVLWNDDESAYNLVVDGGTVVEAVPGPLWDRGSDLP